MNAQEIIEHWIQQIERIPSHEFVSIPNFVSFDSRARTESQQWCQTCLSQPANPHSPSDGVRHSHYVANQVNLDLLRHEHVVAGQPITVFEGINFVIVQLPAREGAVWTNESIEAAIRLTLNVQDAQHHWALQYPQNLVDGTLISTDPAVDPSVMHSWSQRADVLLWKGRLYMICYKRYPPVMGFRHGAQWFEDGLRSKSHR